MRSHPGTSPKCIPMVEANLRMCVRLDTPSLFDEQLHTCLKKKYDEALDFKVKTHLDEDGTPHGFWTEFRDCAAVFTGPTPYDTVLSFEGDNWAPVAPSLNAAIVDTAFGKTLFNKFAPNVSNDYLNAYIKSAVRFPDDDPTHLLTKKDLADMVDKIENEGKRSRCITHLVVDKTRWDYWNSVFFQTY